MKRRLPFGKKLSLLLGFLFILQSISAQILLDPVSHPKFVNELPFPAVIKTVEGGQYKIYIKQTKHDAGLFDVNGNAMGEITDVWGYGQEGEPVTYPGPTIEARSYNTIKVEWINELPEEHLFTIDKTIHWAGTDYEEDNGEANGAEVVFDNGIPTVTHLHGGHTEAVSDGHPEAWYTPGPNPKTGSNYNGNVFTYENSQAPATLWYHDHTIGITRLNVYAGLAGFYLLRDDHEDGPEGEPEKGLKLPNGDYEIPLVIQDRVFDAYGQLVYPTEDFPIPNTMDLEGTDLEGQSIIYNSILPEMFGDYILVNGKVWPYLNVEPRKYRLRLLNGSDSRFYELKIPGVNFFQIGSDGGLLQAPLKRNTITIGPGERIDVIVDFSAPELWGQTLVMKNTARSPYPFGATVDPQTAGKIMAFKVVNQLTGSDGSVIPEALNSNLFPGMGTPNDPPRQLVLFEQLDDYGRLLPSLGTAEDGALSFMYPPTEKPDYQSTEIWEIYNTTPDAHPIHLHLVHFQVLSTQKFNTKLFEEGNPASIQLIGRPKPPAAENAGRKDTFIVYPGEVARVQAYFDKKGEYVWHCHILSHEDHDMMRPFYVGDYTAEDLIAHSEMNTMELLEILEIAPNPVMDVAQVKFRMKTDAAVQVQVHDFSGRTVSILHSGFAAANTDYNLTFNRSGLPAGPYICRLTTQDGQSFEKIIMAR